MFECENGLSVSQIKNTSIIHTVGKNNLKLCGREAMSINCFHVQFFIVRLRCCSMLARDKSSLSVLTWFNSLSTHIPTLYCLLLDVNHKNICGLFISKPLTIKESQKIYVLCALFFIFILSNITVFYTEKMLKVYKMTSNTKEIREKYKDKTDKKEN